MDNVISRLLWYINPAPLVFTPLIVILRMCNCKLTTWLAVLYVGVEMAVSSSRCAAERKRTDLTLSQKVEIVHLVQEKRLSQIEIAKRFECSQSAVSKIVKNKDAILGEADNNKPHSRKRKWSGKANNVDEALYKWFVDARARDAPVTSAVLEEKATHLAGLLGKPEFKATNGWLCRWKSRHGIKFKKAHGEKKDADVDAADQWSSTVSAELLEKYEPCNVYNADETGIYYRALPDGTLTFSTDALSGSKKAKERITRWLLWIWMVRISGPFLLLVKASSHVALGVSHSFQFHTPTVPTLGWRQAYFVSG